MKIGPELAADLFVLPDEGIKKLHMKKILILQSRLYFNILVNLPLFNFIASFCPQTQALNHGGRCSGRHKSEQRTPLYTGIDIPL